MIGLRELASLLAGAIVLFGSVLVPAGEDGAGTVAIEEVGEDTTRALAEQPASIELTGATVYDIVTSKGSATPPATLEGGFETIRFLVGPEAPETVAFGDKQMPIPAGSTVTVEGVSGTLELTPSRPGVDLSLTGTATGLEVQPPSAPAVETRQGDQATIPAVNVTLGGQEVDSSFERGGAFDEVAFTLVPPAEGDDPALVADEEILPFEETVRVRLSDFAGVVAVAEVGQDRVRLEVDGFGDVEVFGERVDRQVHQEVTVHTTNPNEPPDANFTHQPPVPQAGETVHFQANASEEALIRSWAWEFGDGARSEAPQPEHTYASSGTYEVTLTVTDVFGRTDTQTRTLEIVNSRPIVSLDWSPDPVVEGTPTSLEANATDRDGEIVSYEWSIPNRTDGPRGPLVNHTFAQEGEHPVSVTVTDEEGAQAKASADLVVRNAPPEADFTVDPAQPMARETTFLESRSSDYGDGEVVDHFWDIESVGTRDGEIVKVTFQRDGEQEVELQVRDDQGATDTITRNVTVRNAPPDVSIRINPKPLNPGEPIEFAADVTDDDQITAAEWTFSDGVESDQLRTVRTFTAGGTYEATLRVQDADGAWSTTNETFYVNKAPDVELGPLNGDPTTELAVQTSELFTLTARVDDPDSDDVSLSWTVDGDAPAESNRCTHAPDGNRSRMQCGWPDDGRHLIRVMARDEEGASNTARTEILVLNRAPSVDPHLLTDVVNVGQSVTMRADADDPDGTVEAIVWLVEGSRVGIGPEIDHRFDEPGNRTVEVRATDDDGAVERSTFHVEVNQLPSASISVSPDQPVAGEPVTFTAEASDPDGDDAELAYAWTLDDGSQANGSSVSHTYETGGTYHVQLAVTDEAGATIQRQSLVDVDTPPLGADLSMDPGSPQANTSVTFTVSVEDGREIEKIEWAFGDGETETTGAGVQSTSHAYDEPARYDLTVEIHADHGETRRLKTEVRVTGTTGYDLVFEPRLPNRQCLDLSSAKVEVQATNLAQPTTVGLQEGDVHWQTASPCTLFHTLPAGTWSVGDQLTVTVEAGPAETTKSFHLSPDRKLVDRDLRLTYAPLSFEDVNVFSPNQPSQSEENDTYSDPTTQVYVTAQVRWVEGTLARDLPVDIATDYRGIESLQGPPVEYHEERSSIPANGTLVQPVPAPVLEAEPTDDALVDAPGVAYLPGQYRVELTAKAGLASDVATSSFVEDPAGIFAALEEAEGSTDEGSS